MRAVLQRVSSASVVVNGGDPHTIGPGLMILLGVKDGDDPAIIPKLAAKCAGLRIFADDEEQVEPQRGGTWLFGSCRQQLYPVWRYLPRQTAPALSMPQRKPPKALMMPLQELMNAQGLKDVQHGEFGADMQVSLVNDGPVTIIIDTDEWK